MMSPVLVTVSCVLVVAGCCALRVGNERSKDLDEGDIGAMFFYFFIVPPAGALLICVGVVMLVVGAVAAV